MKALLTFLAPTLFDRRHPVDPFAVIGEGFGSGGLPAKKICKHGIKMEPAQLVFISIYSGNICIKSKV